MADANGRGPSKGAAAGAGAAADVVALERVELSDDSDDDFKYDAVTDSEEEGMGGDDGESDDEDLEKAMASLQKARQAKEEEIAALPRAVTDVRPAVVDDFIRNFLIKAGLTKTLETFNTEWYGKKAKGELRDEDVSTVPDVYVRNAQLDAIIKELRAELKENQEIASKAQGTWDRFRKERDFHRMHHKRVMQEKNKLIVDIKRLKKHYETYEPTLAELREKYESAMKEKMLMRLERDRIVAKITGLEAQLKSFEDAAKDGAPSTSPKKTRKPKAGAASDTKLPGDDAVNPYLSMTFETPPVDRYQLSKTFKGHLNAVAAVAFHPKKPVIATASDDMTWKMWTVPAGELIMSGDGHKDWLAGLDFHPAGTHLVTSGGDGLVKLWDFASASCSATFSDHTGAVWGAVFHHQGDFVVSASMDHTSKLWDVKTGRCRQTFRGHVDSVNSVCFQPFSNNICTGAGDKTVSLWDIRSGLCIQTFYGHTNACNNVAFNLRGDTIASCDADGVVKLWDVRMVDERLSIECGEHALNQVCMDRSGTVVAAASDDGSVKLYNTADATSLGQLRGHDDAVQCVAFDPAGRFLVSGGSDNTFRVWSSTKG